ncbi:methyltransferase domain-containing protein [Candidatus Woesearchaeota archaeon]|nr:methyltransferase domain-containing protein [Candidatus Woesearchaeota archaeon]
MQINDVEYLKCIACNSDVKLEMFKKEGKYCIEGKLSCIKCRKEYPVINGIPRILPDDLMTSLVVPKHQAFFKEHNIKAKLPKRKKKSLKERTADTFGFEWLEYPTILKQFEKDWARYFNPFIKKEDIKGLVVADFGCGMAKHGHFISKYKAKKYIGLDLSEAVEACYRNTNKENSLVVQADIYNIPLKGSKVDLFYSIGVLHHLPEPEKGFLSIARLMKKGSKIFIWVYGQDRNLRARFVYNPVRHITTRMPQSVLYPLCHIPAAILHTANTSYKICKRLRLKRLAQMHPLKYYADFPYRFKVSDSYDVFGTPKQLYYTKKDIKKWFEHAKIPNHWLKHDVVQGIKGFGKK